jgi:hypothetical protein
MRVVISVAMVAGLLLGIQGRTSERVNAYTTPPIVLAGILGIGQGEYRPADIDAALVDACAPSASLA